MERINYKEVIIDGVSFVLGVFLMALCFNLFLNPYNLVVSGFSGVSIVFQKLFNWNPNAFIYISNAVLIVFCIIFLGWEVTKKNIIGSVLYPLMITLSMPIATALSGVLTTDDIYLVLLFSVVLYGVGNGLIYRSGFATGGSDIIILIINKYCKVSESRSMLVANSFIILMGMAVFGLEKGVYSFIILACSTYFVDKIMFGMSDSKLFYIYTKKVRKIKRLILDEYQTGFTTIPSRGGYTRKSGSLIMCVVSNTDYYSFKQKILELDPSAFIIINKCYEVNGGVKRSNLPFL